jgi:hypothetical protein
VKGGASPNPKGRPRSGLAFAERVRERVDPDLVIDLAMRVAADEEMPVSERLAALLPLIDRGFLRPPQTFAGKLETSTTNDAPAITERIESMTLEEKRAALAHIRAARALVTAGSDEER